MRAITQHILWRVALGEDQKDSAEDQAKDPREASEKHPSLINRTRPWVLLGLGIVLVVYSLIPPVHPAALTLGASMIGFNPVWSASV